MTVIFFNLEIEIKNMRQINSHKVNPANDVIGITVLDEPGQGGANHEYAVKISDDKTTIISFQNGPINEVGVNGITQEVLIAILIDRLQSFQNGPFKCRENAIALTHLETAKLWLFSRTLERMQRGVEGTHKH